MSVQNMSSLTSSNTSSKPKRILSAKQIERNLRAVAAMSEARSSIAKQKKHKRLAIAKKIDQIFMSQAENAARHAIIPAIGMNYIYKIVTHKDVKGRINKREHILIRDPHEIAHALNCMANDSGKDKDDEDIFYYATVEKPDHKAIESIITRAVGKVPDEIKHSGKIDHVHSLVDLVKARRTLPAHIQHDPFDEPLHLEAKVKE